MPNDVFQLSRAQGAVRTRRRAARQVRAALDGGNLSLAAQLLGRPYRFQGRVVQGRGLGRKLGWPTANLEVDGRKCLPALGVYAAWAWLRDESEPMAAVMNLGPTELLIVLVIVMLLFGSAKLPKLAKSMGQAQREFRQATSDETEEA